MKIDFNFIENNPAKSLFIKDDYIAPIISFDNDENDGHYYFEIKYGKTELAEISFNSKTKKLSCFQLVGCTQFSVVPKNMDIPISKDCVIGIRSFDDTDNYGIIDVFPEKFTTEIYKNGLCTIFSDNEISNSVKSGNLIFSFDSEKNLVRIYVVELNDSDLEHIKEVLQNG